jgi:hypothetical protein
MMTMLVMKKKFAGKEKLPENATLCFGYLLMYSILMSF